MRSSSIKKQYLKVAHALSTGNVITFARDFSNCQGTMDYLFDGTYHIYETTTVPCLRYLKYSQLIYHSNRKQNMCVGAPSL